MIRLLSALVLAASVLTGCAASQPCYEDQPCWNCATMGNHVCGVLA